MLTQGRLERTETNQTHFKWGERVDSHFLNLMSTTTNVWLLEPIWLVWDAYGHYSKQRIQERLVIEREFSELYLKIVLTCLRPFAFPDMREAKKNKIFYTVMSIYDWKV